MLFWQQRIITTTFGSGEGVGEGALAGSAGGGAGGAGEEEQQEGDAANELPWCALFSLAFCQVSRDERKVPHPSIALLLIQQVLGGALEYKGLLRTRLFYASFTWRPCVSCFVLTQYYIDKHS